MKAALLSITLVSSLWSTVLTASADMAAAQAAYERKDYATAFKEFQVLAEQGDSTAQASLGVMYELGKGVPKDYGKARYWYEKSAEQGNDNGQYNLATMYYTGAGVKEDIVEACKWFSIATRNNHGGARNSMQLCLRYLDEKGRSEYEKRAAEWMDAHQKK